MAKKQKTQQAGAAKRQPAEKERERDRERQKSDDFVFRMSQAPTLEKSTDLLQFLPITIFSAVVIVLMRMYNYQRPMDQFYWTSGNNWVTDFFSYYKMLAILVCAVLAIVLLLYRLCVQELSIKRCFAYIPMIVYSFMVIVSYLFCGHKEFSLLGYNARFEGTLPLLAYMVMLFYIINSVNDERNVRWVIYPIAVTSTLLGILGISQALDHDFFRTAFGQKAIMPNGTVEMTEQFLSQGIGKALSDAGLITEQYYTTDQLVDMCKSIGQDYLSFTFQNKEIYQTVFNINYVSFYLTLLLPLFGMVFIRSVMRGKDEPIWKKLMWGALFALLLFNLIGSASSGGWLGMGFVVIVALIVLNKKIIRWWKPVAILLVITVLVGGITYDRWIGELTGAVKGTLSSSDKVATETEGADGAAQAVAHKLNYIDTDGYNIVIGIDDNTLTIETFPDEPASVRITDQDDERIKLIATGVDPVVGFDDDRFLDCYLQPAEDEEGNHYLLFTSDAQKHNWPFRITDDGVFYMNGFGNLVDLDIIPHVGFENNQTWGSGRGYILSRTFPMMKDTMLLGYGPDTYCIYFPHNDYVGKLNSGTFSSNVDIIVDKPHCMYLGAWIGSGGISVIALLALYGIYLVQSFMLYFRNRFDKDDFLSYVGAGIFLGVVGFLVCGLVDDSSVSVMPLFYTLLGTGIAVNIMLKKRMPKPEKKTADAEIG